jgi:hypothetical protein
MTLTATAQTYLQRIQRYELEPGMVNLYPATPSHAYPWIAANIDRINQTLNYHLLACQDCFHPQNRISTQIFAAPIHPRYPIDAFCNIHIEPITIVFDVGRIVPSDWLKVVAHEYAHAVLGSAGHNSRYSSILKHLCLGLGFDWPEQISPEQIDHETALQSFPLCRSTPDADRFWTGQNSDS